MATVEGNADDGYQYLYVYPDPEGIGKIEMRYYWTPEEVTKDGDESGLPAWFDDLIILKAALRALIKGVDLERYQLLKSEEKELRNILLNNAAKQ